MTSTTISSPLCNHRRSMAILINSTTYSNIDHPFLLSDQGNGRSSMSLSQSPLPSNQNQPLSTSLCNHTCILETDALLHRQMERLHSGLSEARKRHCRALLSVLEQQASKRLGDKDEELSTATRRNQVLVEKVRRVSAENQMWFTIANNNEAVASSLSATLDQVLLQTARPDGLPIQADDAQSCCLGGDAANRERNYYTSDLRRRRTCRACGQREVCVLLLPCRHLCLCGECEPGLGACPVCCSTKNASLQIHMPWIDSSSQASVRHHLRQETDGGGTAETTAGQPENVRTYSDFEIARACCPFTDAMVHVPAVPDIPGRSSLLDPNQIKYH